MIRVERHKLGPRLHVFGRRVHEYQIGLALLVSSPFASLGHSAGISLSTAVAAVAGLWLVVKDWPDLFRGTRDQASWRLGVHRLPAVHRNAVPSTVPARSRETAERIPALGRQELPRAALERAPLPGLFP